MPLGKEHTRTLKYYSNFRENTLNKLDRIADKTQRGLAKHLGVDEAYISHVLKGRMHKDETIYQPNFDFMVRTADYLGVDLADLLLNRGS